MSDANSPKAKAALFAMAVEFEQQQKIESLRRLAGGDEKHFQRLLALAKKIWLKDLLHPQKPEE